MMQALPVPPEEINARLMQARQLVAQLEQGNCDEANRLLDGLARIREGDLFKEVGKLTRELHDTLQGFRDDSRLESMMMSELPDAKERLNYVVDLTEQAAHRTMNMIDQTLPISRQLDERAYGLHEQWGRFMARKVSYDEFQCLVKDVDQFFTQVSTDAQSIQSNLSDVYMAQDFQDLTGQVIRRVIKLVQDVEQGLVGMIRLSGAAPQRIDEKDMAEANRKGHGHAVPGVDGNVVSGQDAVDDLLSSLGF